MLIKIHKNHKIKFCIKLLRLTYKNYQISMKTFDISNWKTFQIWIINPINKSFFFSKTWIFSPNFPYISCKDKIWLIDSVIGWLVVSGRTLLFAGSVVIGWHVVSGRTLLCAVSAVIGSRCVGSHCWALWCLYELWRVNS